MLNVNKYVKSLEQEEGVLIHRNKGELDITLPYGLYKKYDSDMYKFIVTVAKDIHITKDTKEWTKENIDEVNKAISKVPKGIESLAIKFYEDFAKEAHVELYPPCCRELIFSIYINSPYWTNRAVQRTIINMVKSNRLELTLSEISIEDGFWGNKTKYAIEYIRGHKSQDFYYYFEEAIANNMKDMYDKIVEKDRSMKKNIKGWKNRVKKYQEMR